MEKGTDIALRIRGIYATALTRFFLDAGLRVVSPSRVLAVRFEEVEETGPPTAGVVDIDDLENRQGILLLGPEEQVETALSSIRDRFFDAVLRRGKGPRPTVEIEFPHWAKSALDALRARVVPTLLNHHRLRIIASDDVDRLEANELPRHPSRRDLISRRLEDRCLWETYTCGKTMALEHVKPDGRTIPLSDGEIVDLRPSERLLVLKRARFRGKGPYDGLDSCKEPGDYALSSVKEGAWHYTHTYFRKDGRPIGDYVNINTPVEFYPDRIRYVDLEIDVVRRPDGRVEIIDQGDLERQYRAGHITDDLKNRALETAREVKTRLQEKGSTPFLD